MARPHLEVLTLVHEAAEWAGPAVCEHVQPLQVQRTDLQPAQGVCLAHLRAQPDHPGTRIYNYTTSLSLAGTTRAAGRAQW